MKLPRPQCNFLLSLCRREDLRLGSANHYRCLRRSLLVIMLVITLTPLLITSWLSFHRYRQITRQEALHNLRWHTESARRSLEVFLERAKDAMVVVANTYTMAELAAPGKLEHIFAELRLQHPGLVDMSIIGPDGIQHAYVGPFALQGKSYADIPWYQAVLERKVLISEMFSGFRKVPHFVVAVTKREGEGGDWVVRGSVDAETLNRFLGSIATDMAEDIFLVSQDGYLQTASRNHGQVLDFFPLLVRLNEKEVEVTEKVMAGKAILQAIGVVQGTPWLLVVEQKNFADRNAWLAFRNQLLAIFVMASVAAVVVIVRISRSVANRVREADESRERLFADNEHTNKLASLGRLAAGVAHEINNPLAIINEKAGLMKDLLGLEKEFPRKEKFLTQLDSLEGAVKRARIITHRLLGFARRMESSLQEVQINEVITEVLGFLDKEAMYRDIKIILDLQPDLPVVESDQGQLQQIFLNIINNAIDAIDKNGNIAISSRLASPKTVLVEISDSGPGIPEELIHNIFEPFFTTKQHSEKHGTGLGLSITYGLVKKLGGEISVASTEGQGTTFSLGFPLKAGIPEEGTEAGGSGATGMPA
ncbi:MAG: sensor histidine kinase [Thermodesulfobacteriota bacterium]